MSRRKKGPNLEGSHPQELNVSHRHFLVRSLQRNDVELAALLKINKSLRQCRSQILESCGELVLLDLGSGRLTLFEDELHHTTTTATTTTSIANKTSTTTTEGAANVSDDDNENNNEDKHDNEKEVATTKQSDEENDKNNEKDNDNENENEKNLATGNNDNSGGNQESNDEESTIPNQDKKVKVQTDEDSSNKDNTANQNDDNDDDKEKEKGKEVDGEAKTKTESESVVQKGKIGDNDYDINGNDSDDNDTKDYYELTPAQRQLCVDFLLRMKLRRKLANRLIRRLNRVAQAMDGVDVNPPPPPRYGDLRLHVDPTAVTAFQALRDRQAKAQAIVEEHLKKNDGIHKSSSSSSASSVEGKEDVKVEAKEESSSKELKANGVEPKPEGTPSTGSGVTTMDAKTVPSKAENTESTTEEVQPMEVDSSTPVTTPPPADVSKTETKPKESTATATTTTVTAPTSAVAPITTANTAPVTTSAEPNLSTSATNPTTTTTTTTTEANTTAISLEQAYTILKEYDDAYDKVWDAESQSFQYILSEQEVTPDYESLQAGAAIGATARLASQQEREQEFKRWQTSVLARIPQQPTFEELGMKNRVFLLNERRKRCLEESVEEEKGDKDENEEQLTKKQKTESEDEKEDEDEDDKDNSKDEKKSKTDASSQEGSKGEPIKKIKLEPRKKKEDETTNRKDEDEEVVPEQPKRIKPMSLAAIPSFYDQDLVRIRNVHGDLMGFSVIAESQKAMNDATAQYNRAFAMSNQIFEARQRIQQNMQLYVTQGRAQIAKATKDHAVQANVAKAHWMKQKYTADRERVRKFLPSTYNRQPFGTQAIQQYSRRGPIQAGIASCLADVVDGAIIVVDGNLPNNKFPDFKMPDAPKNPQTGELLSAQITRTDNEFRQQLTGYNTRFQQSEENRQRLWTKLMKTKAELGAMTPGRAYIDMTNYHRVPLPQLRTSGPQVMAQGLMQANVASYRPPTARAESDSKYSIARVRERISADGSVAPITEPKKDRDGLFVRPAGRKRKGMDWDAVRGIWVPEK